MIRGSLAAVSAGLALALAFPAAAVAPLAWVALLPLLWAIAGETPRRAFALGSVTGLVFYLATFDWIPGTIVRGTAMPAAVAFVPLVLLSAVLATSLGFFAGGTRFFERRTGRSLLWIAPPLWTAIEWLRVEGFGVPWSLIAATQSRNLNLVQMAEGTGVYGVGAVIVAVNVATFELLFHRRNGNRGARRRMAAVLGLWLAVDAFGAMRLEQMEADPGDHHLRVGIVQPAIDPLGKWDPRRREEVLALQEQLSLSIAADADLIVWPEASAPFVFASDAFYEEDPESFVADRILRDRLAGFAVTLGVPLVFGAPALQKDLEGRGEVWRALNRVFLLSPQGRVEGQYDKMVLVPFGEYVPWPRLLWFVHRLVPAVSDFIPGREQALLHVPGGTLAPLVCFEATFPDFVRRFADRGAGVLLNLTNDAWFGDSAAPRQHLALAALRAVENRTPLVRVANTGISAVVGADGRFLARIGLGERAARVVEVPWSDRTTFYSRHGDVFAATMALAAAALLVYATVIPAAPERTAVRVA